MNHIEIGKICREGGFVQRCVVVIRVKDNIEITIVSKKDAPEILEVQKQSYLGQAEIYNNYELPALTQSLKSLEDEFNKEIFLKALFQGKIVGLVRFRVRNGHIDIDRIAVKPEFQNQGIGTALLKEIESRATNVTSLQLFTGSKSRRNIYLYKKNGYKILDGVVKSQIYVVAGFTRTFDILLV